jgi:hypothetical protein
MISVGTRGHRVGGQVAEDLLIVTVVSGTDRSRAGSMTETPGQRQIRLAGWPGRRGDRRGKSALTDRR